MPTMTNRPAKPPSPGRCSDSNMARRSCALFVAVFVLCLMGCSGKKEPISRYTVAKPEPVRLLGAIIPNKDKVWFVKLLGPEAAVSKHEKEFDQFLSSINFPNDKDKPIAWRAPKGWTATGRSGMREETFKFGPTDAPLELTITSLGKESNQLLSNINRWRGQMALPHATAADLKQHAKEIKFDGNDGWRVDMTNDHTQDAIQPGKSRVPAYVLPEGWTKSKKAVQFSVANFEIQSGESLAEVTLSPLPVGAQVSGVVANINRWRAQVSLPPASDEDIKKELREMKVDGTDGFMVDLSSPANAEKKERILGVVIPGDEVMWFIKMRGPVDLVEKQKTAFDAFLKSVRFGGSGANP